MRQTFLILLATLVTSSGYPQETITTNQKQEIVFLIDQYSKAREKQDTVLLKSILTPEVDQLVSSGEWRLGIGAAVTGMLRSSESNPRSRKLIVERIRLITPESGIVDARYEIQNPDGTVRKMWSTFVVVRENKKWKITAIRNMLPSH
ncbi:MAG TPA: DUF4440 domain-containing protein [Cyclobacteriaceae bacterium]|nr:DUF4440 domain-containing protein [Cyclobacteriaceae bacterium]